MYTYLYPYIHIYTYQVCIQFCSTLGLTETLFRDILNVFVMAQQEALFLKALAQCVIGMETGSHLAMPLSRTLIQPLRCLPTHILLSMQKIVEAEVFLCTSSSPSSWSLFLLEQCIVSLDMHSQRFYLVLLFSHLFIFLLIKIILMPFWLVRMD